MHFRIYQRGWTQLVKCGRPTPWLWTTLIYKGRARAGDIFIFLFSLVMPVMHEIGLETELSTLDEFIDQFSKLCDDERCGDIDGEIEIFSLNIVVSPASRSPPRQSPSSSHRSSSTTKTSCRGSPTMHKWGAGAGDGMARRWRQRWWCDVLWKMFFTHIF